MKNRVVAAKPVSTSKRAFSSAALLGLVVIFIASGFALLLNASREGQSRAQAADVSVVSSPTLAAGTVDAIFARVGSPMRGLGSLIEQMSRRDSIDDAFALGVWWTETNDGEAGVGLADRNPGSVRGSAGYPSAWDGYTIYPSYSAAVVYWFNMLRSRYVGQGLSTVYAIARPYVGTTSYPLWAAKVINLMYAYRGLAPPPPAVTRTPKPEPAVNPLVVAANRLQQNKMAFLKQWRANHSFAPLTNQGTEQEIILSAPASSSPTPPGLVLAMILLGLFMALAVIVFALWLGRASKRLVVAAAVAAAAARSSETMTEPLAPVTPEPLPVVAPTTAPRLRLPASSSPGSRFDRRVTLRPAALVPAEPVLVTAGRGARPGGLLSRYGQP